LVVVVVVDVPCDGRWQSPPWALRSLVKIKNKDGRNEEKEREKKGSVTTSVHIDQPQWLSTSSIQTNVRARRKRESLRRQIKSDTADTQREKERRRKKKGDYKDFVESSSLF
jgi:hypothetical protein